MSFWNDVVSVVTAPITQPAKLISPVTKIAAVPVNATLGAVSKVGTAGAKIIPIKGVGDVVEKFNNAYTGGVSGFFKGVEGAGDSISAGNVGGLYSNTVRAAVGGNSYATTLGSAETVAGTNISGYGPTMLGTGGSADTNRSVIFTAIVAAGGYLGSLLGGGAAGAGASTAVSEAGAGAGGATGIGALGTAASSAGSAAIDGLGTAAVGGLAGLLGGGTASAAAPYASPAQETSSGPSGLVIAGIVVAAFLILKRRKK